MEFAAQRLGGNHYLSSATYFFQSETTVETMVWNAVVEVKTPVLMRSPQFLDRDVQEAFPKPTGQDDPPRACSSAATTSSVN